MDSLFIKCNLCPGDLLVSIADGCFLTVVGIGDIKVDPFRILTNVFHVAKLLTNFISIEKVVTSSPCRAYFDRDICVIFDKLQRQRIGVAREQGELCLLEGLSQIYLVEVDRHLEPLEGLLKIRQFHQRMDHPSFGTLKILVPILFRKVSLDTLKCDV